jgi:ribonuclease D
MESSAPQVTKARHDHPIFGRLLSSNMIETADQLASYLENSRQGSVHPVCAIDTEADSLHRYRESLCLIQFADRDGCVLIDPLAIEDLSSLGTYLSSATVW